ncbi:MAG: DUF1697 domain-containing protein [Candidatus Saccharimonadales bacterium]
MKYVALLRGINVGGKNKVDMKQLVAALIEVGLEGVSYYLNTGNIFFASDASQQELTTTIHDVIEREFGLDIKVLLRDETSIQKVTAEIPSDWQNTPEIKCNVMFLWEKYDTPDVLEQLKIRPEIDEVFYESGAVVWRTKQSDFNRSGMSKLVGSDIYKHMTIRNVNTFRKIAEKTK